MIIPHQGQGSRPLIFGEVLFDTFPDGARVLGGAPFNVAWHLQGFGVRPLFISAVGKDPQGEEILTLMREWDMDIRGVQIDEHHPTGIVAVTFKDGQPSYDILPHQAYDFISAQAAHEAARRVSIGLLYHGSLAIRHEVSRAALQQLGDYLSVPRCIDINLRAPWWKREDILDTLQGAACVKLNDDELVALISPDSTSPDNLQEKAQLFREQCRAQILVVTRGARGALLITPQGVISGEPVAVASVVDTVGAGDAFSAVVLLGLLRGWGWTEILERALAFAAKICTVRGATLKDRTFYHALLNEWGESADG